MEEQKNELISVDNLQDRLQVELSKIETLEPIYPIDEEKVNNIDTTDANKLIILASHNYPRVHQYPNLAQRFRLLIAINKTILFVGHNVQDVKFLYDGVLEYVRLNAKHLTMEELEIAFKKGAMDEYGEWHGLSAMTFCKWIKGYVNSTKRNAMKEKEKIKKMENQEKEKTPEEKLKSKKDWLENILVKYDEFLKSDEKDMEYYDFMNYFFFFLFKTEILSISEKEGRGYVNQGRINLRSRSKREIDDSDIQREAKFVAVKKFLRESKINKVNLREIIQKHDGWRFLEKWVEGKI